MIRLDAPAFVYIFTNHSKSTLYEGMTTKLMKRITDHKNGEGSTFCIRYNCNQLVFLRDFISIKDAIALKKTLATSLERRIDRVDQSQMEISELSSQ